MNEPLSPALRNARQTKRTTRGLMIAAPRSGSGKTTLTLGLLRGLARAGIAVAGAKSGPDYIDPAFHMAATGRASFNFDSWAMTRAQIAGISALATSDAELVIMEASMGLFDGVPAHLGTSGASADIAAALGLPVVLVIDISGQAQSVAAIVKGCMVYDARIKIAGVVLNRVSSPRHQLLATGAIEALGVPVLGALPRNEHTRMPERHLGLVQAGETAGLMGKLDDMADFVAAHVDVARLTSLAATTLGSSEITHALRPPGQRIALAQDDAFSFIYPHLLAAWRLQGAEIVPFSPLCNEAPAADCDVCWLPGGYPELHAGRLSAATTFLEGLHRFAKQRPVHGECGGYMVLGTQLVDADGTSHAMAGLLSVETSFAKRKMHLGYRHVRLLADGPLGRAGTSLRGHEFHYASILSSGLDVPFAEITDAYGAAPSPAGSRRGHVTGSFFHVIAEGAGFEN